MSHEFEKCLERGSLVAAEPERSIIAAELDAAAYDLRKAEASLSDDDPKWATIKAYYTIFHAVRALVRAKGYKERSHYCLLVALRHVYPEVPATAFESAMSLREEADYESRFSKEAAAAVLKDAKEFLKEARQILNRVPSTEPRKDQ